MANKRIAGITIEIGGDTTKLQTALKGVDSQLSKTQANLRDVNKLLKLDPGNTELLTQKQKNLQKALGDTRTRLKTLKDAQKESMSPEQYDALQREIIETEENLKSLEKEYKKFGSVGAQQTIAVGNKVKSVGDKISTVGGKLTKNVTLPIAALGAASYKAFTEVDEGLDIITKKTGATGDSLDGMGKILEDIATSIPTDFKTAGTAIGDVNTRFGVTGDQLRELSEQYIKFAQINDTDVTNAVNTTQKALAAFNLGADDAGKYLDYLTATSQSTGASVDTLAGNIVANSTAFQSMGLSIYDATMLMGQLEVSGADSGAVISGLSKALKNATDKGIPLNTALGNLQKSIEKGKGSTDGLTLAYDLFGKSGAQVYEAVKNGTIDFNNLAGAAQLTGTTVTDTFNATLDPADQFTTAMNALKLTGAAIAEVVMPALNTVLGKVRDVIVDLKARWDGLDDSQKQNIVRIVGVVAAIGPLLVGIGKLVSGVGSAITVVGNLKAGFAALNPATVAIGAAVAAAAAFIIANWDDIKAYWETTLKPKLQELKTFIVETVIPAVQKAWQDLQPVIETVFNAIKSFWDNTLKPAMQDLFKVIVNTIIPAVKKAWEKLQPIVTNFFKAAQKAWNTTLKPALEKMYDFIVNTLVPKVSDAWNALQPVFETVFNAVKTAWETVGAPVMELVRTGLEGFITTIRGTLDGLITFISGVFTGDWSRAWSGVKKIFGTIFGGLAELVKKPINGVIGLLNNMIGKIEGALNNVIGAINSKVRIHLDPISVFGKEIFGGLDWGPNIKKISMKRIKTLYSGGVLGEGERAMVGEFAPEYLTVRNGQAVVTPLPGAKRFGGETINNTFNIYAQPGQNVQQIANEVERIFNRQAQQTGAAYA